MITCAHCQKKMTMDETLYLENQEHLTFALDLNDKKCEVCDSRTRAKDCALSIAADIAYIVKRNSQSNETVSDGLREKLILYWIKKNMENYDLKKYRVFFNHFCKSVRMNLQQINR